MKKKEFKRSESLIFLVLEILGKAVELKSLQIEEMKIRSPKIVYPSGGKKEFAEALSKPTDKEFVIPKSLFPIQNSGIVGAKEIHEEALENGLKTEKKCETALDLINQASPVEEPLKTESIGFEFPKENYQYLYSSDDYFFIERNKWSLYIGDSRKQLFCFDDRKGRKVILLNTEQEILHAIYKDLEIYFKWRHQ